MTGIIGKVFFRLTDVAFKSKSHGIIMAGILEAPRQVILSETMCPAIVRMNKRDPIFIIDTNAPRTPKNRDITPFEEYDLSGLTIADIWRTAEPGYIAGDVFFRKTLVPTTTPQKEAFAFVSCMMVSDEALLEDLPLEQLLRFDSHKAGCFCHATGQLIPKGNTVSGLLKEPLWGVSGEPVALQSDLPLPIIEGIQRYYHHRFRMGDNHDLLKELARDYRIENIIHHLVDEEEYSQVMKEYFNIYNPPHLTKALTASQIAEKREMMSRAMQTIHREQKRERITNNIEEIEKSLFL